MSLISNNLQAIHARILTAARNVARDPQTIKLLAVSKTFGVEAVIDAAETGHRAFGENYLQEAIEKMTAIKAVRPDLLLEWHFIGPIQSNKTRQIAEHFDWVHSIERVKIAQRLAEQRPTHLPELNVCLQVNVSGETNKSGVVPGQLLELAQQVVSFSRLKLRGLMAIPEPTEIFEQQRLPFRRLREMSDELCTQGIKLDTLSIGMSADMNAAIAEGATIVRVGTAIFGGRRYAH